MTHTITIQGQHFVLHPSGALFWKEQCMLLLADVHFGKITHFRKHGSAVPPEALYTNFEKLDRVLDHFNPERLCFLGDLFHSYINMEWDLFQKWIQSLKPSIILITGNHDIISPIRYEKMGITCREEWIIQKFQLTHHPEKKGSLYNLCGHVHPAIKLKGKGKQTLKLACFYKRGQQLILPAFGTFTGTHCISPRKTDEVFALAEKEVLPL